MTASVLGVAALGLLSIWRFGDLVLRIGGLLIVLASALGLAVAGNAEGLWVLAAGVWLWLVGHGLYRLRHGAWKSRLAASLWWVSGGIAHARGGSVAQRASGRERDSALDERSGPG